MYGVQELPDWVWWFIIGVPVLILASTAILYFFMNPLRVGMIGSLQALAGGFIGDTFWPFSGPVTFSFDLGPMFQAASEQLMLTKADHTIGYLVLGAVFLVSTAGFSALKFHNKI